MMFGREIHTASNLRLDVLLALHYRNHRPSITVTWFVIDGQQDARRVPSL